MFEDLFATPIYYVMLSDDDVRSQIDKIIGDVKFTQKQFHTAIKTFHYPHVSCTARAQ